MPLGWLGRHLGRLRDDVERRRLPAPLRQSVWCANGLHGQCTGWTVPRDSPVTCLCPCHQRGAGGDRAGAR